MVKRVRLVFAVRTEKQTQADTSRHKQRQAETGHCAREADGLGRA